jgi:regulator of protease activity HflC (stomatin/prohibitin superfamily)
MKKNIKTLLYTVAAVVLIILFSDSMFILNEDESAIVERFGRIESVFVKEETPGLAQTLQNYSVPVHTGTTVAV